MVALFCMVLVDPGACGTPAKDALKTVRGILFFPPWFIPDLLVQITEELIRHGRLTTEAFCVQCLVGLAPQVTCKALR